MLNEPHKQPLAVVVDALDPHRGPDVRVKVGVPGSWLAAKASISVVLPRLAACAGCDGGGCERCSGSGALPLRGIGDAPTQVELHLSPAPANQALLLRLPDLGPEPEAGGRRGCVLLEVSSQPAATANVKLVAMVTTQWKPNWYPWIALVVALAILVVVAFLGA